MAHMTFILLPRSSRKQRDLCVASIVLLCLIQGKTKKAACTLYSVLVFELWAPMLQLRRNTCASMAIVHIKQGFDLPCLKISSIKMTKKNIFTSPHIMLNRTTYRALYRLLTLKRNFGWPHSSRQGSRNCSSPNESGSSTGKILPSM